MSIFSLPFGDIAYIFIFLRCYVDEFYNFSRWKAYQCRIYTNDIDSQCINLTHRIIFNIFVTNCRADKKLRTSFKSSSLDIFKKGVLRFGKILLDKETISKSEKKP